MKRQYPHDDTIKLAFLPQAHTNIKTQISQAKRSIRNLFYLFATSLIYISTFHYLNLGEHGILLRIILVVAYGTLIITPFGMLNALIIDLIPLKKNLGEILKLSCQYNRTLTSQTPTNEINPLSKIVTYFFIGTTFFIISSFAYLVQIKLSNSELKRTQRLIEQHSLSNLENPSNTNRISTKDITASSFSGSDDELYSIGDAIENAVTDQQNLIPDM